MVATSRARTWAVGADVQVTVVAPECFDERSHGLTSWLTREAAVVRFRRRAVGGRASLFLVSLYRVYHSSGSRSLVMARPRNEVSNGTRVSNPAEGRTLAGVRMHAATSLLVGSRRCRRITFRRNGKHVGIGADRVSDSMMTYMIRTA